MKIIYPTDRLLSNPRVIFAIASSLGGPDGEVLQEAFLDLMEHGLEEFDDPDDCEFEATEVCFRMDPETGTVEIILDTGLMSVLQPVAGEFRAGVTNDSEMAATSALYAELVRAIEKSHPELTDDIVLSSPPTPGNGYLRSIDGDRFEGEFHLLSDPEKQFAFNIEIVDVSTNDLKASVKPL